MRKEEREEPKLARVVDAPPPSLRRLLLLPLMVRLRGRPSIVL